MSKSVVLGTIGAALFVFGFMGVIVYIGERAAISRARVWEARRQIPSESLTPDDNIKVWHDDTRNVTCWILPESNVTFKGSAISCLSDADINK